GPAALLATATQGSSGTNTGEHDGPERLRPSCPSQRRGRATRSLRDASRRKFASAEAVSRAHPATARQPKAAWTGRQQQSSRSTATTKKAPGCALHPGVFLDPPNPSTTSTIVSGPPRLSILFSPLFQVFRCP